MNEIRLHFNDSFNLRPKPTAAAYEILIYVAYYCDNQCFQRIFGVVGMFINISLNDMEKVWRV